MTPALRCSSPYTGRLTPSTLFRHSTNRRCLSVRLISKKVEKCNVAWTQDEDSVTVGVQVNQGTKAKEIALTVLPTRMKLVVQGATLLEGTFPDGELVNPDGSYFTVEEKDGGRMCVLTLEKKNVTGNSWLQFFSDEETDITITDKAYLDVRIGDEGSKVQRVELGLYGNECPKTVANFKALCTGEQGVGKSGKPLHYKGNQFHRIIKGFMAQAGDFTNGDGTGGESIYGQTFDDEPGGLRVRHNTPLKLCMANAGPDTNGSQFYITFAPCPHLDGNHVVFGEVDDGHEVLLDIDEKAASESGEPEVPVTIVDCGVLDMETDE